MPGSSFVNLLGRPEGQEAMGIAEGPPTTSSDLTGVVSEWLLFPLPESELPRELKGPH